MEFKIEKGVLKSCFPQKSETEIIVPDGIHTIGAFAFSSLTVFDHVEYISIPEGVTKIGELAFQACHNLKRISLPETLIEIGNSAFANCRSLEKIRVPDSVLSIGDRLFFWCTGLKTIILPTQLKAVPIDTFLHCQSLEHIDLPQYLEEIGPGAFCDCLSLKSITIPKTVKDLHLVYHGFCDDCPSIQSIYVEQGSNSFQSKNGVLFTAGGTELIRCPEGFLEEEYVIPEEIINIRQMAFKNCMSLRRVVLPESLERISFWAFGNCKNLIESNIYPYFQRFNNDRILSKVTAYVWIDIFDAHVSKGTGIRAIQDKLGIRRDETIVFGDYLNDLPMAEYAVKSFAPSNAHPEVKRRFTDVIGSNEEGSVTKTIRELLQ